MADAWLGISSANLDSFCGENPLYPLGKALDADENWLHNIEEVHWFVLDLGQPYVIKKVRGRSILDYDPIDVNIYIDNDNPPTTLCKEGITTWQDTEEWVEITLTTIGLGRYIKVEIENSEGAERFIWWGKMAPFMTLFDAYGSPAPRRRRGRIIKPRIGVKVGN